jgi:hypothetical protein
LKRRDLQQRRSAIDARTTRHLGYRISQTCRKIARPNIEASQPSLPTSCWPNAS